MEKSESINELAGALAKAQAEIENASKNSNNPHFKSKYADLAEVLNTVRPVFAANGLSFVQMPSFADGKASVETVLMHSSGQYIANTCSAPVSKQDAQGVGSAITYLRRYSLAAFAGVAQEDDDGQGAVSKPKPAQPKFISPEQQAEIMALINQAGGSIAVYLEKVLKLQSLADMPIADFDGRIKQLETKIAEKKAAAIQAAADRALNDEQGEG